MLSIPWRMYGLQLQCSEEGPKVEEGKGASGSLSASSQSRELRSRGPVTARGHTQAGSLPVE